jgi:predicted TPR repeat methyltransferase
VYNFLGQIRLTQGDDQAATRLFTQALTTARRAPDRITILISLYNLAVSSHALGDLSGAAAHLTEGLSLAAESGDEASAAYYLEGLAVMATPEDNPQRAVHLLAAAWAYGQSIAGRRAVEYALNSDHTTATNRVE